ncbi:MAG: GntR family transcriptional regulator [Hyphomicrobiaceae bacterium]|nr:GntR family transcriptional regulator [Hyphomicrobiaceae bacterium]
MVARPDTAKTTASAVTRPSSPALPKYAQIRDFISERIASGEFARGTQLPSEHEFMAQFAVSRVTVRQAFDSLRTMGLVEARQGRGHFVSRLQATASLERLQSFGEMMAPHGMPTRSDVVDLREIAGCGDVLSNLALDAGAMVTHLARVRLAGCTVISLDVSYLPLSIGRQLMYLDIARQDVYLLMERRLNIEVGYADVTLDVAPLPAKYAHLLCAAAGASVLRLRRVTYANSGAPVMFEHIYSRLDMLEFQVRIPRW